MEFHGTWHALAIDSSVSQRPNEADRKGAGQALPLRESRERPLGLKGTTHAENGVPTGVPQ